MAAGFGLVLACYRVASTSRKCSSAKYQLEVHHVCQNFLTFNWILIAQRCQSMPHHSYSTLVLSMCAHSLNSRMTILHQKTRDSRRKADIFLTSSTGMDTLSSDYRKHVSKNKVSAKLAIMLRVVGGANDSGQLGCEIWLHDRLGGRTLTAQSLVCYHSDPRRIFLRLQHVGLDLYLVNLHAPHSGYDDTSLENWWKETLRHSTLVPCVY